MDKYGKNKDKKKLPKIFYVNWFKKDIKGKYIWPGFSENIRVLKWIFNRVDEKPNFINTEIGRIPDVKSFDTKGLSISFNELFKIEKNMWKKKIKKIENHYSLFGKKLPKALTVELQRLKSRIEII